MIYDSTQDQLDHVREVQSHLVAFAHELLQRAIDHDRSKLRSPEKEVFDRVAPRLKELTYGSDEYKAQLEEIKPALEHHYEHNSHHPEYWCGDGVNGMSLVDVVEMVCDWCAAVKRHKDGDIWQSLKINKDRFKLSDQLADIIENTVQRGYL